MSPNNLAAGWRLFNPRGRNSVRHAQHRRICPRPAPSGALTAPATTNLFAAAVTLVLFVLSAVVSAGRTDVTQDFDEAAHAIHVDFSYGRHLATGWLMDAYPRYCLPLTAIMPLAGRSLYRAIEEPRGRNVLLAFLIAGPAIFRIFGAPFG